MTERVNRNGKMNLCEDDEVTYVVEDRVSRWHDVYIKLSLAEVAGMGLGKEAARAHIDGNHRTEGTKDESLGHCHPRFRIRIQRLCTQKGIVVKEAQNFRLMETEQGESLCSASGAPTWRHGKPSRPEKAPGLP